MRPRSTDHSQILQFDILKEARNISPIKNAYFSKQEVDQNLRMRKEIKEIEINQLKNLTSNTFKSPISKKKLSQLEKESKFFLTQYKPTSSVSNSQIDFKKKRTQYQIVNNNTQAELTTVNPSINASIQLSIEQKGIIQKILTKNQHIIVNMQKSQQQASFAQKRNGYILESESSQNMQFNFSQVCLKQMDQIKNQVFLQEKNQNKSHLKTNSNPEIFQQNSILFQRFHEPQKSHIQQIIQHNQELIHKQSEELVELEQHQFNQKRLTEELHKKMKGQRSISTPDISFPQNQVKSIKAISQPGKLHTKQIKTNQDSFVIVEKFNKNSNQFYLQVSDGHGANGHQVAEFVKENLPYFIEQTNGLKE